MQPENSVEQPPELVFYLGYCTILQALLKLTKRDSEVLASIMYQNYKLLERLPDDFMRWHFIFTKQVREEMRDFTNMSYNNFNNSLTNLRSKRIILVHKDTSINKIKDTLIVFPTDNKGTININFNIVQDESNRES